MLHRRSDSGCRGRFRISRLLLALILAVLVSADKSKTSATTDGLSSIGSSTTVMSTSTVGDTPKTTTLSNDDYEKQRKNCYYVTEGTTVTEIITMCGSNYPIGSLHTLDFSNENEKDLEKVFSSPNKGMFHVNFIISNSTITTINFGKAEEIGNHANTSISIQLINNKYLKKIVKNQTRLSFNGKVTVRGNRFLDKGSLKLFSKSSNDIQEEKECFQDDTLDFDGCDRIYGNLTLNNFKDSNFKPIAVSECLVLDGKDGELDVEKFLERFNVSDHEETTCQNVISGYCLKKETQAKLKEKFGKRDVKIIENKECTYECSMNDLNLGQDKCVNLTGDIVIMKGLNLGRFSSVRNVFGTLKITGLDWFEPGFLNNLENIISTKNDAPALAIVNNTHSSAPEFFYLRNITSPTKKKFLFENNGFNCNDVLKKKLSDALQYAEYCGEEPMTTTTHRVETNTKKDVNSQNEKATGDKEKTSTEESGLGGGAIAGIIVGVLFVVLVVAAVGIAVPVIIRKRRSKTEKNELTETKDSESKQNESMGTKQSTSISTVDLSKKAKELEEEKKRREKEERNEEKKLHEQHNQELEKIKKDVNTIAQSVLGFRYTLKVPKVEKAMTKKEKEKKEKKEKQRKEEEERAKRCPGFVSFEHYWEDNCLYNRAKSKFGTNELVSFHAHMDLNRFQGTFCLEHNRVKLTLYQDELKHDYIHANEVTFENFNDRFIATQFPIVSEFTDKNEENKNPTDDRFFTMVQQFKAPVIVQLQEWSEEVGKYIPLETGAETKNKMFTLKNIKSENHPSDNPMVVLRNIEVTHIKTQNKHTFLHVYMLNWPDKKVPEGGLYGRFKVIWDLLKKAQPESENNPVIVHCKAGVGRTMAFIIAMHMISAAEKDIKTMPKDMIALFKRAREERHTGIQTKEQFLMLPSFLFDILIPKCKDKQLLIQMKEFNAEYLKAADQPEAETAIKDK